MTQAEADEISQVAGRELYFGPPALAVGIFLLPTPLGVILTIAGAAGTIQGARHGLKAGDLDPASPFYKPGKHLRRGVLRYL